MTLLSLENNKTRKSNKVIIKTNGQKINSPQSKALRAARPAQIKLDWP